MRAPAERPLARSGPRLTERPRGARRRQVYGADIPSGPKRVDTFAKQMLAEAVGMDLSGKPALFTLPGKLDADGGETLGQVGITGAFEAPDVLENCVGFLRQHVKDTHAHAAALLVPKGSIGYPQVWQRKGGKKGWRFGDKDGLFVQVEAPGDRRLYFVPAGKAGAVATDWPPLDVDLFCLMPPLFK